LKDFPPEIEAMPAKTIESKSGDKVVHTPNPDYAVWVAKDQSVLGYLLSTLNRETLMGVSSCTTSAAIWSTLQEMYSSQSRARSVNTRIALATTKKNQLSVADYFAKMRSYADEMAASGNPLGDEEFVAYILAGIDPEVNSLFTAVISRAETIKPAELYAQLLSFEHHLRLQAGASLGGSMAMNASHGRSTGGRTSGFGRG
jgi:hypothetical protein